jgi:phage terminase large subunit GpA-like protein
VDSRGHRGQQVRAFVQRTDIKTKVYACQGSTTRMGRAIASTASYPDKDRRGKTIRGGYAVWNIGTEFCKDYLFGHLSADSELATEDRRYRFPCGLPTEYFDGLLSEVYNPDTKRYEPKRGAKHKRNEPLDGMVGAWAIGQHKEVNIGRFRNGKPDPGFWSRLAATLEQESAAAVASSAPAQKPADEASARHASKPVPKPKTSSISQSDWSSRL